MYSLSSLVYINCMRSDENKLLQPSDPRLAALHNWLTETKLSRRDLGLRLGLSVNAVQKWFERESWPEREDERIEQACGLPRGYFARIAQGQSHEEAAHPTYTLTSSDTIALIVEALRTLPPLDPSLLGTQGEVREMLARQSVLLFGMVYPGRKPTPEGIEEIRKLLEEKAAKHGREEK